MPAREGRPRAVARLISLVEDGVAAAARGHGRARAATPATPTSSGLTGSPGVGKSTTTSALVRAFRARGRAGRRARRRPVLAVHRRRAARRPGPDAGPRHRPGRLHPVDVHAAATSAGCPAATPQAVRVLDARRLRRRAGRDGRRRAVRGRGRLAGRHHASCCSPRAWATRSRRPRRASSRSATCSWSTRPTATAPTRPSASSSTCSASTRPPTTRAPAGCRRCSRPPRGRRRHRRAGRRARGAPRLARGHRRPAAAARAPGGRGGRGDRARDPAQPDGRRSRRHHARAARPIGRGRGARPLHRRRRAGGQPLRLIDRRGRGRTTSWRAARAAAYGEQHADRRRAGACADPGVRPRRAPQQRRGGAADPRS